MSDNENPIHAPNSKGGRPRESDEPRVSRTVTIDARTNRLIDLNLARLRKTKPQVSPGHVIDRMAVHCVVTDFDVTDPEAEPQRPKKKSRAVIATEAASLDIGHRALSGDRFPREEKKKPARATTPTPAPATSGKA